MHQFSLGACCHNAYTRYQLLLAHAYIHVWISIAIILIKIHVMYARVDNNRIWCTCSWEEVPE